MDDLKKLMPHHRPESKMERTKNLQVVNEMCEMKNCNKTILFEGRRKRDLYVWFANVSTGPSVKFLVENSTYYSYNQTTLIVYKKLTLYTSDLLYLQFIQWENSR